MSLLLLLAEYNRSSGFWQMPDMYCYWNVWPSWQYKLWQSWSCWIIFRKTCWWNDCILGASVNCYPVPAVGSSLSSLGLSFLQPSIRKCVLVETIWAKRARSTTLIKVSTRFTPDEGKRETREITQQVRLSQWFKNTKTHLLFIHWSPHEKQSRVLLASAYLRISCENGRVGRDFLQ